MAAISVACCCHTMSASIVDDGTKPPVAIVLITSETASIMSVEPKAYSMETNISMYMENITMIVPKSSRRCSVLPDMNPRMVCSFPSG